MVKKEECIQFVDGDLRLDVTISPNEETVWLTQSQISQLFERDRTVIGRHIRNVFADELDEKSNVHFLHVANSDKPVAYYNLDVIISVGYRVKSKRGILFRKWATKVLKEYMIQGVAINEKRLRNLQRTIEIQNGIISGISEMAGMDAIDILQVLEAYTQALDLLDDYDHQRINKPKGSKTLVYLEEEMCHQIIEKTKFSKQSDLFGIEREKGMLKGILDQIKQHVFGQELYPSLEEKAANLLYMLVKDHIYFDGNKRLAAIMFLEFLNQNHMLFKNNKRIISNDALVAITLMIAQSNPIEKDVMVNIVMNLLVN